MRIPRFLVALTLFVGTGVSTAFAQDITLASNVPFHEDSEVSDAIRNECTLGTKLADSVRRHGPSVVLVDGTPDTAQGRVLELVISDAENVGNAFMGRQTFTKVRGTLFQDGQKVASFKARRNSMGGAFAGFKGACSVLGRTVDKLGEDIGGWLKSPRDGAALGD